VRPNVAREHPDFGSALPCRCASEDGATARLDRLLRYSNIGSLTRLTFANLIARGRSGEASEQEQYKRCVADARAFAEVPEGWLVLTGASGCGKTHIAAATVNRLLERGQPALFVVVPDLLDHLRAAFQQETELFLDSQIREDRPVTDLLTANYTFVNERLARHYGIPDVLGSHFRRVTLPADSPRGGLLGQGGVLMVTSYADRTSVVVRGKYILQNLLGIPPPPPPPDVPPLEDTEVKGTLRQRMELHRKNPVCASCHNAIDPLGFALENFDGIGKYRTTDANAPVDASGSLPDGTKFSGPAQFRTALMAQRDAYVATLTEKLLTYALGRGAEHYDMPAIRSIIKDASRQDYRWSALITGIVRSMPFQMRRSES
jgi:hypothetical protein